MERYDYYKKLGEKYLESLDKITSKKVDSMLAVKIHELKQQLNKDLLKSSAVSEKDSITILSRATRESFQIYSNDCYILSLINNFESLEKFVLSLEPYKHYTEGLERLTLDI